MNPNNCLDFEKPIAELEAMLKELRHLSTEQDLNISDEIARLEAKSKALTESIFATLTPWQISQIARHPLRPYTLDYLERIFTDFQELHGDRTFADDHAIVAGLARLQGRSVLVIGHQKGRDTKEKIYRNFGMPRPEGYRKALRLMKLAERFRLPILTFIDTPGAYPGIGAEERGQSEAIARNLFEMSRLRTPVIGVVIGEGGSGGALAVGVCDRVLMLQYGTYSVISPEGCAAILWKSADKAPDAAEAMGLTADRLLKLNLIDGIIPEPPGGAHRDPALTAENVRIALQENLRTLDALSIDDLLEQRYQRLMSYGVFKEAAPVTSLQSTWQSSVAALLGKDKES
jgi:acetyl-CoA carboxylase carboxyl transferase subunit alpha